MDFIDLRSQRRRIADEINAAIARVLEHGQYVLGPEVSNFETALAKFGNAKHALGCANGTDAIILPLLAWGIGPGDAVFCPSFTYVATAEAIALIGATPVFVDIDRDTYNMCPASLKNAIAQTVEDKSLTPEAVITVDLFGQAADYPRLAPIAKNHGLKLLADSAQGFGGTLNGHHPLHWCDIATTSFFPAKPLGCYGDGGAVLTNDNDLADAIDSLRIHGKGLDKYDNVRIGMNSRLDAIQAAILTEKLKIFPSEISARMNIAARYSNGLKRAVERVPALIGGGISSWAQYTIEVKDRAGLMAHLKDQGIPSAAYYPRPIHKQSAYTHYPIAGNGLPNTEAAMQSVMSLPMHAYLSEADQDRVIAAVSGFTPG